MSVTVALPTCGLHLLYFCKKINYPLKQTVKKMKLTSGDNELVLMFLIKKEKKVRFWVHPVLLPFLDHCTLGMIMIILSCDFSRVTLGVIIDCVT